MTPDTVTAGNSPIEAAKTVENLTGVGWAFDASGRGVYLSPALQAALGKTPDELNAWWSEGEVAWKQLLYPDDYERVAGEWRHSIHSGQPFDSEFRIRRRAGYGWVRSSGRAVRDRTGEILGWYGTSIDIDSFRATVETLHGRELELSQLVDTVPGHLWRLTPEGEPIFFNRRMIDYLGRNVTDIERPGLSRLDAMIEMAIHPDDAAEFGSTLNQSLVTGESFFMRYRLRRFDGVYRWMSSRAESMRDHDGRIVQWCGLCHDVNDQVRTEEALKRSEWHLQRLIDALPVNICSWTPEGALSYVSKRFLEQAGLTKTDLAEFAKAALDLIHPDDVGQVRDQAIRCIRSGEAFSMRYRRRGKDGLFRWTDDRFEALRDADDAIVEWYGLSIDVDDEMRTQQSLRDSEHSLHQLVETLPALIYCLAPDGAPIYRSHKLSEYLGFEIEDKDEIGKHRLDVTLDAIIHPDELAAVKHKYSQSLPTGEPYTMRHRLRRFDGEYRWMETRALAMRNADGDIVQWNGVCIDIDDWLRAQEELRVAQRNLAKASEAASLAELTASIAHEIGQPLAAMVSSSDACQQWLSGDPPNVERAQKALERVVRSANTATEVVGRIRALFKHTPEARRTQALDAVAVEARDLMAEEATRRGVRMECRIEQDLPPLFFDPIQIQQVFVNLIRNALEAMDLAADRGMLQLSVRRDSERIYTEISDTGPGVEDPERIFEPFYTTKGQGMGMGLAICRSIVEAHGGRLWVEKNDPTGAKFIFDLPVEGQEA